MAKIWVPTLIVLLAAVQSFGIDLRRSAKIFSFADSLALISQADSTTIDSLKVDSLAPFTQSTDTLSVDSLAIDTLQSDTVMALFLTARDTSRFRTHSETPTHSSTSTTSPSRTRPPELR